MDIDSQQLTIYFDDCIGSLSNVTSILSNHAINILAMTARGDNKNGFAHIVVDKTALACNILKNHGYHVDIKDVICLKVCNVAGALNKSLKMLAQHDIDIEYIYAFAADAGTGTAVIKCNECNQAKIVLTAHCKELMLQ